TLPPEWIKAVRFLHAIVVPSTFCRDAVQRYTSKPVLVVPHPVGKLGALQRAVKSDPHPFRVVIIFRFGSSFERKNPLALLRAFQRAFGRDPTARLILKASDGDRFPIEKSKLMRAAVNARNVEIIDEVWEEARVRALLNSADVYASLHRSEGFGL